MSESVAASATLSVVQLNATTFQYNITLKDIGTTPIGSFWMSWIPGEDFLPDPPSVESAPTGWAATPFGGPGAASVQFTADSPSGYLQVGDTLSGFSFTSTDSPAVIEGDSTSFPGTPVLTSVAFEAGLDASASGTFDIACFAAGTRILTTHGEMAVEHLAVGDMVPTLSGPGLSPVRWIGHRKVDCTRHPRPETVWPVHVCAGALGAGRPLRDLLLSPDHAVYLDGVLIPVRHLVNGATIAQVQVDHVEYWHVELPAHEVLLADGLAVESYLDTGNRSSFANGGDVLSVHPDFTRNIRAVGACAPLLVEATAALPYARAAAR